MTKLEQYKMVECWVKSINQKAFLKEGDGRCGNIYAIATNNEDNTIHVWTDFMTIKEMEKYLLGYFHYYNFINIKNV